MKAPFRTSAENRAEAVCGRHGGPSEGLAYYALVPLHWGWQLFHNGHGILRVLDITRIRPLPAGLVDLKHPWVTGLNPATGRFIWPENVVYASPRAVLPGPADLPPADEVILQRVGRFLAQLVARSAVVPEIPWGARRRMPHGINYIHGAVHYHSGIILFNDFADAMFHFSDARFRAEVCRFTRRERREVMLVFRQRHYEPREFAFLMGFLRSQLPWFCNSNGPRKRVLWGNPAPFPVVNIIRGNWIADIYRLKAPGGARAVVRPPIRHRRYFTHAGYEGTRREACWLEKLFAFYTYLRIRMRGSRGGLFFVDRRKLVAAKLQRLQAQGLRDEAIASLFTGDQANEMAFADGEQDF
jgi:hypothetical protein